MPELPLRQPRIVSDFADKTLKEVVLGKIRQGYGRGEDEFATLARLYPETEYGGRGSQVFVVGHPRDNKKVVAFNIFDSNDELSRNPILPMGLYHLHRILHTLFPYNFPQIYSVAGGKNAQSVREKIKSSPTTPIRYPFNEVIDHCKRIGFPLQIDDSGHNFVGAENGGEYYLDIVMLPNSKIFFDFFKNFNRAELMKYMEAQDIGPESQGRVLNSFRRLRELDVINTIECVLKNFRSLSEEGYKLSDNCWLDQLLEPIDFRLDILNQKSIARIRRFVELIKMSQENDKERKRIIKYLSGLQLSE